MVPGKLTVLLKMGRRAATRTPTTGRILAALIQDARLVTIDDEHLFLVTSAGESAPEISRFLA
jgi:hypothetical protein